MQNQDLTASRWASPEVRRERQSQTPTWTSRSSSPHKEDLPSASAWQPQKIRSDIDTAPRLLSSVQRQYISRHNDLQRFRKLFRRLAWKANSLTHWSHRALNLSQEHQAQLREQQHNYAHGYPPGQSAESHVHGPRATLGSYEMAIDPVEAERQFKIDFYEFYALLERGLVCLLGVWGFVITASAGATAAVPDQGATTVTSRTNTNGSIIGDSLAFHGATHRFHANVIAALDHPSNPLHSLLGIGPVREYIGIAKEFRNKWKDVDTRPEESFKGQERLEEEWDPNKTRRYEKVLQDLKLEELLGSVLSGLEEAGEMAEGEVGRLEGLLGNQGKSALKDADFNMEDAPFEAMAEQEGLDYEMEF